MPSRKKVQQIDAGPSLKSGSVTSRQPVLLNARERQSIVNQQCFNSSIEKKTLRELYHKSKSKNKMQTRPTFTFKTKSSNVHAQRSEVISQLKFKCSRTCRLRLHTFYYAHFVTISISCI